MHRTHLSCAPLPGPPPRSKLEQGNSNAQWWADTLLKLLGPRWDRLGLRQMSGMLVLVFCRSDLKGAQPSVGEVCEQGPPGRHWLHLLQQQQALAWRYEGRSALPTAHCRVCCTGKRRRVQLCFYQLLGTRRREPSSAVQQRGTTAPPRLTFSACTLRRRHR
jgi:hypothetical protein